MYRQRLKYVRRQNCCKIALNTSTMSCNFTRCYCSQLFNYISETLKSGHPSLSHLVHHHKHTYSKCQRIFRLAISHFICRLNVSLVMGERTTEKPESHRAFEPTSPVLQSDAQNNDLAKRTLGAKSLTYNTG